MNLEKAHREILVKEIIKYKQKLDALLSELIVAVDRELLDKYDDVIEPPNELSAINLINEEISFETFNGASVTIKSNGSIEYNSKS